MSKSLDTQQRIGASLLLLTLIIIPFLIPKSSTKPHQLNNDREETLTKDKINILTDSSSQFNIMNAIRTFRKSHPEIGVTLALNEHVYHSQLPDISTTPQDEQFYIFSNGIYILRTEYTNNHIQKFLEEVHQTNNPLAK